MKPKKVKRLKDLVECAFSDSNKNAYYEVGKMPPKQAKKIAPFIGGVNMAGAMRIIDDSSLRHCFKNHGSPKTEAARGQIAVTIDDFSKIPHVLKSPDKIEYMGKNGLKQDVFYYYRQIGDVYVVAECVRFAKDGNRLVFASMFIKRKPLPR